VAGLVVLGQVPDVASAGGFVLVVIAGVGAARADAGDDNLAFTVRDTPGTPHVCAYGHGGRSGGQLSNIRSSAVWVNAVSAFYIEEAPCGNNCGPGPATQPDGKTFTYDVVRQAEDQVQIAAGEAGRAGRAKRLPRLPGGVDAPDGPQVMIVKRLHPQSDPVEADRPQLREVRSGHRSRIRLQRPLRLPWRIGTVSGTCPTRTTAINGRDSCFRTATSFRSTIPLGENSSSRPDTTSAFKRSIP